MLAELAVIIDLFAALVAFVNANALWRLVFTLARYRLLSAVVARKPRHETLAAATLLIVAAATLWLPVASAWGNRFELIALLAVATVLPGRPHAFVGHNRFLREAAAPSGNGHRWSLPSSYRWWSRTAPSDHSAPDRKEMNLHRGCNPHRHSGLAAVAANPPGDRPRQGS